MVNERSNPFPPPPENWLGSIPEWYAFKALERLNIDFDYQSSFLGGRLTRGGAILDFFIPSLNLGIAIQSNYWHYSSSGKIASDKAQRIALEGLGLTVIWIQEDDVLRNPMFYVREAVNFREHVPAFV